MNERLLNLLRCPRCASQLRGRVIALECSGCAARFPIVNGVPRLTPGAATDIAQTFGFQWRARAGDGFERGALYGLSPEDERQNFFTGLGIKPAMLRDRTVLDAGCGDGFLLGLLAQYEADVVGIDIGSSIEVTAEYCRSFPRLAVLQADLMSPPFAPRCFDYVWCEGVLVHTEDPVKGFDALANLVKPGGSLYVWVYPQAPLAVYQRIRDMLPGAHRLPRPALRVLCYGLAIPLGLVQPMVRRRRYETYRTLAFNLFDNLSPRIQTRHTVPEVRAWFETRGFVDVTQTGLIGMRGTKIA